MVKLLKPITYILPHHVALPTVKLGDNLRMTTQEYLWLQLVANMII